MQASVCSGRDGRLYVTGTYAEELTAQRQNCTSWCTDRTRAAPELQAVSNLRGLRDGIWG